MKFCKNFSILLVIFFMSCSNHNIVQEKMTQNSRLQPSSEESSGAEEAIYSLKPGDEIAINIWRYDDLNRNLLIDPSGKIYPPLCDEIQAAGLTIPRLKDKITKNLRKYIIDPKVDINVSSLREFKIHVLGEVRSVGPVSFSFQRKLLLWEAISRAGGFTNNANTSRVFLVRQKNSAARFIVLNLEKMLSTGKLNPDLYLQDGDIVYVPEKVISNIETFMVRLNNILSPFITVQRGIILGPEVADVITGEYEGKDITISP